VSTTIGEMVFVPLLVNGPWPATGTHRKQDLPLRLSIQLITFGFILLDLSSDFLKGSDGMRAAWVRSALMSAR